MDTVEPTILAYLAGVIDSDGTIGIKRSTYQMRVTRDCGTAMYSERVAVKQVEPQAVTLLHDTFGGHRGLDSPSAKKGRPLHRWIIGNAAASRTLALLLPYLRIKAAQAENALALRCLLEASRVRRWPVPAIVEGEPMVTATEFAALLGANRASILEAVRKGSVPSVRVGVSRMIPVSFAEAYRSRVRRKGAKPPRAIAVTAQMEALYQQAKRLNHVGVAD